VGVENGSAVCAFVVAWSGWLPVTLLRWCLQRIAGRAYLAGAYSGYSAEMSAAQLQVGGNALHKPANVAWQAPALIQAVVGEVWAGWEAGGGLIGEVIGV
jgi:hypothetical protein